MNLQILPFPGTLETIKHCLKRKKPALHQAYYGYGTAEAPKPTFHISNLHSLLSIGFYWRLQNAPFYPNLLTDRGIMFLNFFPVLQETMNDTEMNE